MGLWLSWSADGQHRKGYAWPISHQRIEFTDLARSQGRSVRAKIVTSTAEPQKLRTAGLGGDDLGSHQRRRDPVGLDGEALGRRWRSFDARPVRLWLVLQAPDADAEELRRLRAVALGPLQGAQDVATFHLAKRKTRLELQDGGRSSHHRGRFLDE